MPSKKSLKKFELIIVVALIGLLWYYGFDAYRQMIENTKAASMAQELKAIRQAIYMYVLQNHTYPQNLKELNEKKIIKFEGKIENQKYIKSRTFDEKGDLIDPFGNPYIYDNKKGDVRSSTKGYEDY